MTGPRPQEGTPEWGLWVAAIEVALAPPLHPGEYVWVALVPWKIVHRLRLALDDLGVDWAAHHRDSRPSRAGDRQGEAK